MTRHVALLTALVVTSTLSGPGFAQQPYVLGSEDLLEVTVLGYLDLTRLILVRPDGKISLPLVGTVTAAGLTVERLTQVLTRAYAVYIRNPQVTIIVKEFRKIRVSVLGRVARPGTYALSPGSGVLEAISIAGGLTEDADLKKAQLLRPGEPPITVDLEQLLAGDLTANVPLRGGETLVVPEDLANLVNVLGEVVRPGRYRLKGEMRVLDVLLLAGGLTERASVTQARLVRGSGESQPLFLDSLLLRQDMSRNIVLRPGDTLIIPEETNNKIYVLGDVNGPGAFVLKGEVTVVQAIAMAGGLVQRGIGAADTAYILRRSGSVDAGSVPGARVEVLPGSGVLITIDLRTALQGGVSRNIVVQPGDVIVVPQTGLGGLQVVLSILLGLRAVFR